MWSNSPSPRPSTDLPVQKRLTCDKLVLKPETGRAFWNGVDVGLTLGEYKLIHLLVSNAGSFVTYRAAYDRLRFEGFIAGNGNDGFRANVRSAIKRIRNKFRACDPAFDEIENYTRLRILLAQARLVGMAGDCVDHATAIARILALGGTWNPVKIACAKRRSAIG